MRARPASLQDHVVQWLALLGMLVVERTLSVLTAVAQLGGREVGLADLAQATELSPSTLHRHVASLLSSGYLRREDGSKRVELGPRAMALGAIWLDPDSIYARIRSGVVQLQAELGETAFASQLAGDDIICIAMQRGSSPLHLTVSLGQTIPARRAASARVVLAHLSEQQALTIAGLSSTKNAQAASFLSQLGEIRDAGFDTCTDELDAGVWAVAAPIWDPDGRGVVGALATAGPMERFRSDADQAEAIELTREIAHGICELPR